MGLRYKFWKKKFKDATGKEQEKFYAVKETNRCVSTDEMAKAIEYNSALTSGDVLSALSGISSFVIQQLSIGDSVNLKGIGTINVSVTSTAMDSPDDIASATVKTSRITFRPDPALNKILENMHFSISPDAKKGKR